MTVTLERPLRVVMLSGLIACCIPAGETVSLERIPEGWRVTHGELVYRASDVRVKESLGCIERTLEAGA